MLNQDKILHTIFGTAKIDHHGYYIITTRKEGNNNQQLHRLIYEKFWGVKIPKGVVIHHKDGNKLNNCILNLEAMTSSDHWKLHTSNENNPMYNKNHSLDSVLKMSKSKNSSGYFRVHKEKSPQCNQGFLWKYQYYDENKKRKSLQSVDIDKLKEKVLAKGLEWRKI